MKINKYIHLEKNNIFKNIEHVQFRKKEKSYNFENYKY